ncbi:protein phosphatase [Streptomyces sp. NPDC057565]|uniref:protein-tyrosine phosphatase family protein n=1 Tax=Streptomyces sp. NPDC057565 TaxID=3346169 RepID=UPI0036CFB213
MKTRHKSRGIPEPQAPWNEIVPGLWMGGHYWMDGLGEVHQAVVDREFELVISLFTRPDHGPAPDVDHQVAEIPDDLLTSAQLSTVQQLAWYAARSVGDGHRTLVRCNAGFNRSGLLVGQALIELGYEPTTAIDLIRQRRSPWALNNRIFEEYLATCLDVACLLTSLDTPS